MRKLVCSCSVNSQKANIWTWSIHLETLVRRGSTEVLRARSRGTRAWPPAWLPPHSPPAPWPLAPPVHSQVDCIPAPIAPGKTDHSSCPQFQGAKSSFPEDWKTLCLESAFALSPTAPLQGATCGPIPPAEWVMKSQAISLESKWRLQESKTQPSIAFSLQSITLFTHHCVNRIIL